MTDAPLASWLRRLRAANPTPDAELLRRFHGGADPDAFELLLHRHAPVVLRVCRAVTRDPHLAEDAAQAVFLVLARKAGSLAGVVSLSAWLVRVAYRIASRVRSRTARQHAPLAAAGAVESSDPDPASAAVAADLAVVTLEEVQRLPERYHTPVVLCLLEGLTLTEAADRLGWPSGTVAGRLARAKRVLRDRLARRGIVAPSVALTALDVTSAYAAPDRFTADVLGALGPFGPAPRVHQLVQEMTSAMTPFIFRGPVLVAAGLLVAATVALTSAAGPLAPPTAPADPQPRVPSQSGEDRHPLAGGPGVPKPQPRGPNRVLVDLGAHLTLLDPDGKNPKRVDEGLEKSIASQGRLSPDGTKIAFLVVPPILDKTPGKILLTDYRLHVRDVDGKGLGTELGSAKVFAWSPDGTEIAASDFTVTDGLPEKLEPAAAHFVANVRTEKKTALDLPKDHVLSDWSRDGKRLVTTRLGGTKDAPSSRVYLMNRDGTEHKAVTDDKGLTMTGKLSPDGRRVLYTKLELTKGKPPVLTLFVSDLTAGTSAPVGSIPQDVQVQDYCWSPDGKRIAYTWRKTINAGTTQEETEAALVICDPDGTNEKDVLTDKRPTNAGTLRHVDWR